MEMVKKQIELASHVGSEAKYVHVSILKSNIGGAFLYRGYDSFFMFNHYVIEDKTGTLLPYFTNYKEAKKHWNIIKSTN